MRSTTSNAAGFTLLEVLVAVVILGFLMLGLAQGTRFGLTAWAAQDRLIGEHADLDAVDRALRSLVERMDSGTARNPAAVSGTAAGLVFTSVLPTVAFQAGAPPGSTTGGTEGGAQEGTRADMLLTVDPKHELVLRWTPHLHALRLGPPPLPRTEVLLRGVERLDLSYWAPARRSGAGGGASAGGWTRAWNDRKLPGLVRLRFVFVPDDRRRWPDIVAAPLVDAS